MAGMPRRRSGKTCGAKTRTGAPCKRILLLKGGKCPNHGGRSLDARDMERITRKTGRIFKKRGPATPEGRARRDAGRDRFHRERRLAALRGDQ